MFLYTIELRNNYTQSIDRVLTFWPVNRQAVLLTESQLISLET